MSKKSDRHLIKKHRKIIFEMNKELLWIKHSIAEHDAQSIALDVMSPMMMDECQIRFKINSMKHAKRMFSHWSNVIDKVCNELEEASALHVAAMKSDSHSQEEEKE